MTEFQPRAMSKTELALLYLPGHEPHAAVNQLMRWVNACQPLCQELEAAGYNTGAEGVTTIPVFGVDATDAAKEKIADGSMTGTIKQDAEGMANAISTITQNLASGKATFEGIDSANVVGTWRVNIPYATYTGE